MKKFANTLTYLALAAAHSATLFGIGAELVTFLTAVLCALMAAQEANEKKND